MTLISFWSLNCVSVHSTGLYSWPVKGHARTPARGRNASRGLDIIQPMAQVPIYGETITTILKDKTVLHLGCDNILFNQKIVE